MYFDDDQNNDKNTISFIWYIVYAYLMLHFLYYVRSYNLYQISLNFHNYMLPILTIFLKSSTIFTRIVVLFSENQHLKYILMSYTKNYKN